MTIHVSTLRSPGLDMSRTQVRVVVQTVLPFQNFKTILNCGVIKLRNTLKKVQEMPYSSMILGRSELLSLASVQRC